jgi:dihydropteroate synthase
LIISIDTTKSKVADAALVAGAKMVNDISGATFDENMFQTVSKYNAAIVLMHIQGKPQTMQIKPKYEDVLKDICRFLDDRIKSASRYDIKNVIIDPGFGFGKQLNHNYEILERLDELKGLGKPIMAGLSNKSMLGNSLNLDVSEREHASIISETIAVQNGARFIRTHNVKNAVQLKKLYNFVNNPGTLENV